MPVKVILGLPYLSDGPLLAKAKALNAPVLVSANALSRWVAEAPGTGRHADKPPLRRWLGWNKNTLKNARGMEVHLDSAGFVMMLLHSGYPWTPENYVHRLGSAFPWARFSSLDLCVEPEIAHNRADVNERIAKTINLNKRCQRAAADLGIADRLMPVIQGATPDDYLRCFDALEATIGAERVIGVGSMCRRKTGGPDGIVAIVDALDRRLPKGIKLHLFGLKSDGAESVANLDHRIESIDSQAYGVRARHMANERRKTNPAFSKSNAFVAEVMEEWYLNQVARMNAPRPQPLQNDLVLQFPARTQHTDLERRLQRARDQINALIEEDEMDYDQAVSDYMLLQWASISDDDEDAAFPIAA